MAAPTIVSVNPPASSTGVLLSEPIEVLFDQEMDEDRLRLGAFVVSTEALRVVKSAGPIPIDYEDYLSPDVLSSSGFKGIIEGELTFKRINLTDLDEYTGSDNTTGESSLWRTKLIFQPTLPLEQNKSYAVVVSDIASGITVLDQIETKTGTGSITFSGPYLGDIEDTFTVTITESGNRNTSSYVITRYSDNYTTPTSTSSRYLTDVIDVNTGLKLKFGRGTYVKDDTFVVNVKPAVPMDSTYGWSFRTGLIDNIIPETVVDTIDGSTIVNEYISGADAGTSTFAITSITPEHGAANQSLNTNQIIFRFNGNVDPSTVIVGETITAEGVSVDNIWNHNDTPTYEAMGTLDLATEVAGNLLIVTILNNDSAATLQYNNEIRIYLTDGLKNTSGVALDNYLYYFTTRYNPIYCDISQVLAEIGSFLGTFFPEDIIYRLLLRYSKMSDALIGSQTIEDRSRWQLLRSEWILCNVIRDVLKNTYYLAGMDGSKKRLGDISVQYPKSNAGLSEALNKANDCVKKLEDQMRTSTCQTIAIAVKGCWDPEDPHIGRGISRYSNTDKPYVSYQQIRELRETYFSSWRYSRRFLGN